MIGSWVTFPHQHSRIDACTNALTSYQCNLIRSAAYIDDDTIGDDKRTALSIESLSVEAMSMQPYINTAMYAQEDSHIYRTDTSTFLDHPTYRSKCSLLKPPFLLSRLLQWLWMLRSKLQPAQVAEQTDTARLIWTTSTQRPTTGRWLKSVSTGDGAPVLETLVSDRASNSGHKSSNITNQPTAFLLELVLEELP